MHFLEVPIQPYTEHWLAGWPFAHSLSIPAAAAATYINIIIIMAKIGWMETFRAKPSRRLRSTIWMHALLSLLSSTVHTHWKGAKSRSQVLSHPRAHHRLAEGDRWGETNGGLSSKQVQQQQVEWETCSRQCTKCKYRGTLLHFYCCSLEYCCHQGVWRAPQSSLRLLLRGRKVKELCTHIHKNELYMKSNWTGKRPKNITDLRMGTPPCPCSRLQTVCRLCRRRSHGRCWGIQGG